jgi:hypothetical protein
VQPERRKHQENDERAQKRWYKDTPTPTAPLSPRSCGVRSLSKVAQPHRRAPAVGGIAEEKHRLLRGPLLPRVLRDAAVLRLTVLVTSASEETVKGS